MNMILIALLRRILLACASPAAFYLLVAFVLDTRPAINAPAAPFDQSVQNPSASCSVTGTLEGVDVSEYHSTISWTQVAQTKSFAYARARDGVTFTDTTFLTNYVHIKSASMKAGAYLFFEPAQDPIQQASLFVAQLRQAGFAFGDLAPVIDVEITGGQLSTTIAARLQTAVNVIEGSLHVTPVIYTAPSWWNANVSSTAWGGDPLWVAYFRPDCPSLPVGWSTWTLWQYTDTGMVTGIGSFVDLDRSNGAALPIYTGTEFLLYLPPVLK